MKKLKKLKIKKPSIVDEWLNNQPGFRSKEFQKRLSEYAERFMIKKK